MRLNLLYFKYSILWIVCFNFFAQNVYSHVDNCQKEELVVSKTPLVKISFCYVPYSNLNTHVNEKDSKVKKQIFGDFELAQFELTQEEFFAITGRKPWLKVVALDQSKEITAPRENVVDKARYPAVYLSSADIKEVIIKLNKRDPDYRYSLPDVNEMSFASKSAKRSNFYWGDDFDGKYVYNFIDAEGRSEHAKSVDSCPDPFLHSFDPGYCANQFGLMHLRGNVSELSAEHLYAFNKDIKLYVFKKYNITKLESISKFLVLVLGGSWSDRPKEFWSYRTIIGFEAEGVSSSVGIRLLRRKKH